MPAPVCDGAKMICSRGTGESRLSVTPNGFGRTSQSSLATIEDCVPLLNIPPFRSCLAPANPQPASPGGQKPCTPRFHGPWSDEVDFVKLHEKSLLEQRATLACDYGGTVRLLDAGQEDISMNDNMLKAPLGGGLP